MLRFAFFMTFALTTLFAFPAFAEEVVKAPVNPVSHIAAALAIGLAAFGGALGQGRAAAAALEGIARNPGAKGDIFVPMLIGLALIESLVIYALLIAFLIMG
jgi:F-type H+-transporting ATPase subunit c